MKIDGNAIRPDYVIQHQGRLWLAVKTQHTQPGKGGAYMQVELKDLQSGTKLNERFRAGESVERVRLDETPYQFLFANGDDFTFMNQETFDQVTVAKSVIGEPALFLQEGMVVIISSYEGNIIRISLPKTVIMAIVEADPVVKGQTASSSYKPALLENGVRVMVPPHIAKGTKIVVNTEDGTYVERAKED